MLIVPSRQLIAGARGFRKPSRPVLDLSHPINRGLVGCWPLGDALGNVLFKDLSLSGNNGTGVASPTLGASHHGGLATVFANASTQYIDLGLARPTWLGAGHPITVSAWIKLASNTVGSANAIILNGTSGSSINWELRKLSTTQFDFLSYDGVTYSAVAVAPSFTTGVWYHIVGQWQPGWAIFWNGILQSGTITNGGVGPLGGATHAYIGRETGTVGREWDGSIDGVRVYNRALSASEVARLFSEPYAGIVEQAPRWRVGVAAGGATRPVKMVGRWGGYAGRSGGFAA